MAFENALASVAVKDLDRSAAWYAQLLGTKGNRPMPEVEEWMFPRGGGLQVYLGPERAGKCSCTLVVRDIEEHVRQLVSMGIDIGDQTNSARVKTAMVKDPDGNSIALAEAFDPTIAR